MNRGDYYTIGNHLGGARFGVTYGTGEVLDSAIEELNKAIRTSRLHLPESREEMRGNVGVEITSLIENFEEKLPQNRHNSLDEARGFLNELYG